MLGVRAVFACGWDRERRKEIRGMSTLQGGMRRRRGDSPGAERAQRPGPAACRRYRAARMLVGGVVLVLLGAGAGRPSQR